MFRGAALELEDLYLLEGFQISYLPGWVPERAFAALLHAYPAVRRYLVKRYPPIGTYLRRLMVKHRSGEARPELDECVEEVLWTIADLIVYNKCPEVYDSLDFHDWDFGEVTEIVPLDGLVVIDGGAGTGRVTLEAAATAHQVYAIEPVSRLRQFIREKAMELNLHNVFVLDGFLDAIPLPEGFADLLITSHALGWRLERELAEFERVVRRGGILLHCPGTAMHEEAQHKRLVSDDWGYKFACYQAPDGRKRKYWKRLR
jgi:SAM-dependent methyltransferase